MRDPDKKIEPLPHPPFVRPALWTNARTGGKSWIVQDCPYCGKRHSHGAGEAGQDPFSFLGHRIAHCSEGGGTGYILVVPDNGAPIYEP